jgi:hypothetical protein
MRCGCISMKPGSSTCPAASASAGRDHSDIARGRQRCAQCDRRSPDRNSIRPDRIVAALKGGPPHECATMTAQAAPELRAAALICRTPARRCIEGVPGRYCHWRRRFDYLGRGWRSIHRRVRDNCRNRGDTPQERLSGIGKRARPRYATNPASCDARRQPRPALALLVFSQAASIA